VATVVLSSVYVNLDLSANLNLEIASFITATGCRALYGHGMHVTYDKADKSGQ
jgi:hypothetical protein